MKEIKAKKRIEELTETINENSYLYYVLDSPRITDFQYDKLMEELLKLENEYPQFKRGDSPTQRVGGEILKEFNQIVHGERLLSLDNS